MSEFLFPDDYELIDTDATPINSKDFTWGEPMYIQTATLPKTWCKGVNGDIAIYMLITVEESSDLEGLVRSYSYYRQTKNAHPPA